MIFREHSELKGEHAFLSPSNYYWVNYTEAKLTEVYLNKRATERGTELHDIAARLIKNQIKLPNKKETFNMYVNDAIGFRLHPEQVLIYSANCFGTADAIDFNEKKKFLRIHDLKTGKTPASFKQLEIYMALFCHEYRQRPEDIGAELRIYQNDEILIEEPDKELIRSYMDTIIEHDKVIERLKEELSV